MKKKIEIKQEDSEIDFSKIVSIPLVHTNKKGILTIEIEMKDE